MRVLGTEKPVTQLWRVSVAGISTFLLFQFVSLYLSWPKQMTLGALSVLIALLLNRTSKSRVVTLALMLLSMAATLRYGWWRLRTIVQYFSDESNHRLSIDSVLMLILLSAEAYTMLIMVLGFMQTSTPLKRKPVPLPADEDLWPHVDVLIPTYNEPLSLVRYTALAANNMDYPPDKLHVYILDDGTRPGFQEFASQAGIGYIVRETHDHAKAGNINHALTKMQSPLVTIFDCDHVPTRSFLQVTAGWFLQDEDLAMLQTPHFFYSPDPFERNLLQFKTTPNEGGLFYGIIQDGNDLWNATFFCGSCAVIRREALDEVGGIAVETVTEDAHTSLRMQKKGWNTAYINLPQAAGLATETLAAHVGQRVRWARGMIQILRIDNPLFASGMKLSQRLCYFNAMLHFMYAVPRLVFLFAPLVYILAGRTIIPGYWLAILAYGMPHLVISGLTNSRVQGRYRHSFWNEIYETVLAPYILLPTLLALINPKLGKFNVTDKGSTLMETRFDRHIATPTSWMLFFNVLGVCAVPYWLLVKDPRHPGTVLSNLVWILFNMVILGVAAAVANEQQQRRSSVRVPAELSINIRFPNGDVFSGLTKDMSVGGAWLQISDRAEVVNGTLVQVSFPLQTGESQVRAKVVGVRATLIRLRFENCTLAEEETLTCALYSRADSWINSRANQEEDRPLRSLARIVRLSLTGFRQVLTGLLPQTRTAAKTRAARHKPATAIGAFLLLCLSTARLSMGQFPGLERPLTSSSSTQTHDALTQPDQHSEQASEANKLSSSSSVALYTDDVVNIAPNEATTKITLSDMGVHSSVALHGPRSSESVGFLLAYSVVPHHATLNLTYHFDPELAPGAGKIKLLVNNIPVAEISSPIHPQTAHEFSFIALPIPGEFLTRNNELTFAFSEDPVLETGRNRPSSTRANVGATSTLLIAADYLPLKKDLGLLPLPFFDPELQTHTVVPFVFVQAPTSQTLRAAGIVASWLGTLAKATPPRFSVSVGDLPSGNAIVITKGSMTGSCQHLPRGSALSLCTNPSDPDGVLLVVSGDDDAELNNAARSLSLMASPTAKEKVITPFVGEAVHIGDYRLPSAQMIDDAPRWLSTDRLTSLWSLASEEALRSDGSKPLPVYFRTPPDLHYGEVQNLNLQLTYRYNALPVAKGSALRVYLNGSLLNEAPLDPGNDLAERQRSVVVPTAALRPFGNTLGFSFDFSSAESTSHSDDPTARFAGAILKHSFVDLRGLAHWASMPNLELFANAGFPFTRKADLGDTVVVLPDTPTSAEITLFLLLMSHFGNQTGYPALRVDVAGSSVVMQDQRDYLILGGVSDQQTMKRLTPYLPVTFDENGVHVKQVTSLFTKAQTLWRRLTGAFSSGPQPSNRGGRPDLMLEGLESPEFPGRSIVLVSLRNEDALKAIVETFIDRSQSSDISQTVSLFRDGQFTSYTVDTASYHVGSVSKYTQMRIWCAQYFWLLLCIVTVASLFLATYVRDHLDLLIAERLGSSQQVSQPQVDAV